MASCREIDSLVTPYIDGVTSTGERAMVVAHLAACPPCRRRAEAVQTYLVAQRNVPVYRIQIVGLGKDKPVNDEKTRDDRQKNRRVQVTIFSAEGTATQNPGSAQ